MPLIIKHLLFQKVAALPELQQLLTDFAQITTIRVELLDYQGRSADALSHPPASMCSRLHQCSAGKRLCDNTLRHLIRRCDTGSTMQICDAGLIEALLPIRYGGILIAYLRLAGLRPDQADRPHLNRITHLLRRADIDLDHHHIEPLLSDSHVISVSALRASLHLLDLAIQQVIHQLGASQDVHTATLPPLVEQAVRLIRKHALREDLSLEDVAERCQVTPSHLSRTFHHATGLTFREYMSTFRAHHAHDLLLNSNQSITAIALEAGFQSLSQFNRVMKKIYAQSPRQLRKTHLEKLNPIPLPTIPSPT